MKFNDNLYAKPDLSRIIEERKKRNNYTSKINHNREEFRTKLEKMQRAHEI